MSDDLIVDLRTDYPSWMEDEQPGEVIATYKAERIRAAAALDAKDAELTTLRARLAKAEAVVEAARRMRAATEEYVRQTDLEPPDCSVIAEQKARSAEYRATVALDAAIDALDATKEKNDA